MTIGFGPLMLSLSHALLLFSVVLAMLVGWWQGKAAGLNPEAWLFRLFFLALLVARLAFVMVFFEHFADQPWKIIDIRDGGFIAWPGLLAVALAALWLCWRKPQLRRSLFAAVISGLLFWLTAQALVTALEQAKRLPDIRLQDLAGQPVELRELTGKPMVVNLWATWCPPCLREMPVLASAQQARPDLTFVYINQGESRYALERFLSQHGFALDNVLVDGSGQMGRYVGSAALPSTLFYDAQGRQLSSHLGELSAASLARALNHLEEASRD